MDHDNSHNQNIPTSSRDLPILGPAGTLMLGLLTFILFVFAGPHLGIRQSRVADGTFGLMYPAYCRVPAFIR